MKEGTPIEDFDPKPAIKKNAEVAHDWRYSEEARNLYGMAILFKDRLLDPVLLTDRGRLPEPVISFDNLRNRKVLAAYTLHRNPQGLLDEITFNTTHYEEKDGVMQWKYGKWSQFETLLHEQTHLLLNHMTDIDGKKRPAHGKEFVDKCASLGLYVTPVVGAHYAVADGDSPFGRIMKELGIPRPADVPRGDPRADWFRPKPEKGKSTLSKWSCRCPHNIRVGEKDWPGAVCDECGTHYVKSDGKSHNIYQAKK